MSPNEIPLTEKDLAYDQISDQWDDFISHYDENRRIEVLVDEFLGEVAIKNKRCLDAGCGLGYFTERILSYAPKGLKAFDLSPKLVERLEQKYPEVNGFVSNILELDDALEGETFNTVICSEVIEHTVDPKKATQKLAKAVTPGGLLAISVPNQRWRWLLTLAQSVGLRKKYSGHENWVSPEDLAAWIEEEGFDILRAEGIHSIPFKLFPKFLLRPLDKKLRTTNYSYSLNLAVLARKK